MKRISFLLLVVWFSVGVFSQVSTDTDNLLSVGSEMPEFTLKTLEGKTIDSEDLSGKVVLINFFATWCGPCMNELPELQKDIWEKYKEREDFVLLVIGREETTEKLKKWIPQKDFSLPFYPDPKRQVYSKFAKKYIPRNYLFDNQGILLFESRGFVSEDFELLKKKLGELLD